MAEPATVIRWEEPPSARGRTGPDGRRPRGSRYDKLAVELMANPGRSALIQQGRGRNVSDQLASRIRRGLPYCFAPVGDFDACVRSVDGQYRVYARYVGDGENE